MEPDPLPWIILGTALTLLIGANALEVAYAFANRSEVKQQAENDVARAQLLEQLLQKSSQLFLTFSMAKYSAVLLIGAASAQLVIQSTVHWQTVTFVVIGWILLGFLQPIWRATIVTRATTVAAFFAPMLAILLTLLSPFTALVQLLHQWLGSQSESRDEHSPFSDEALRFFVSQSETKEDLEENEREMIASILGMNETSAREIMVPRIDMVSMSVETSLREALDVIIQAGHSRIPVYQENVDTIVGLLYAKDLLKCFRDNQTDRPIHELLRPVYFVPASKKVDALFQEMQLQRVHMVMVVDEYGGTAGLVSIEDILEEIVGDIQDEYDAEEDAYVQAIAPDTYLLNSRLDVYSLTKLLDVEIDTDSADTLGGLIYTLMEHVPERGEAVECEGWRFTVLSLDGRRIEQVRAEFVALGNESSSAAVRKPLLSKDSSSTSDSLVNVQAVDSR